MSFTLRATWGSRQWAELASATAVTYARDGESIYCLLAGQVYVLDRRGRRRGDPRPLHAPNEGVRFAATAPRALVVSSTELRLVDLDRDEIILRHALSAPALGVLVSDDGTRVAFGSHVLDAITGQVTEMADVAAISPDGSLVLVRPRDAPVRIVRVADGSTLRESATSGDASECVLDVHGACAFVERRWSASAWHDRSGTSPDWDEGHRLRIWDENGEDHRIARWVMRLRALPQGGWIGAREGGLVRITPRGEVAELGGFDRVVAISPDGARAIVAGSVRGEIDLATAAPLDVHRNDPVTQLAWSPDGTYAIARRESGGLWRVENEAWTWQRVVAASPFGGTSISPDGAIVVASPDGGVACFEPNGAPRWERALVRGASVRNGWPIAPTIAGAEVIVEVPWSVTTGRTADLEPIVERGTSRTVLDLATGAILRESELGDHAPPAHDPSVGWPDLRRAPSWDPALGRPTGIWPSPDGRTLLVATDAEKLLRLDRD